MNLSWARTEFLLAFAGLLIPVLVHLTYRRRPQTIELGSIRYVRELIDRGRSRRKLMRWLLLSFRVMSVALIALIFARPYLAGGALARDDRLVVVLIDDSASMQTTAGGRTRFDRAVAGAQRILSGLERGVVVEGAMFADKVRPWQADATKSGQPTRELSGRRTPTFGATDYSAAFRWALDKCAHSTASHRQVHVFTDLQATGIVAAESIAMPAGVAVRIHDVGQDSVANVSIQSASPSISMAAPGEKVRVVLALKSYGTSAMEAAPLLLELRRNGETIQVKGQVDVAAASVAECQFELPELKSGFWQGLVRLDSIDDLACDNLRYFALTVAPPGRVLLVEHDPPDSSLPAETFFLDLALRLDLPPQRNVLNSYATTTISVPSMLAPDLDSFDVVVLADIVELSEPDALRLAHFIRGGGSLVLFGGENASAEAGQSLTDAGVLPGAIAPARLAGELPLRIGAWDQSHSIFKPFADPQHGDLRGWIFRGCSSLDPADASQVLARFTDGVPAMVESRFGDGRVIWIAMGCGVNWGDWSRTPLFAAFVRSVFGYVTQPAADRSTMAQPLAGEDDKSDVPGVYLSGGNQRVVNVDPGESTTDRCSATELAQRYGLTLTDDDPPAGRESANLPRERRSQQEELWPWLLMALVGVTGTEFLLANRTIA